MKKIINILVFMLVSAVSLNSYSKDEVESLSDELRILLKQEMLAIQGGMQKIVPAFAAGNLDAVSDIAGSISNSYIMKQKITAAQKHELHEKLSKEFIEKDQQFHQYARMLEHVSKEGHVELVGFYYSKLMESCVGCHSKHAKHRFPSFTDKVEKKAHHH